MKKPTIQTRRPRALLRTAMAAVLACGLMLPSTALATSGSEIGAPTAFEEPVSDPALDTEPEDEAAALDDATAVGNDTAPSLSQAVASAAHAAATDAIARAFDAAEPSTIEDTPTPLAGSDTQYGLTVTGGTEGADYEFVEENCVRPSKGGGSKTNTLKKLVVKSSTPLTITSGGATSNATIWVAAGTQANLTFNNVSIASDIPCHIERNRDKDGNTIEPKTSLHITLAKGSVNSLDATDGQKAPGIHCGEGTVLVIDDDVPNVDASGKPIVMDPTNYPGKIPAGVTFTGSDGKTRTAGTELGDDRLSLLESTDPGSLSVTGALTESGIGSVEFETSGDMTFNGGKLTVTARGSKDSTSGRGAAIGGASAGCGGTITINGGTIETWTSYHGASIGGGAWAHNTQSAYGNAYQFPDTKDNGLVNSSYGSPNTVAAESKTWAGNIYINGGVIEPHGDAHGNAIGQGCCSWNKGHEIVIAGGTVLPDSSRAEQKGGDPRTTCVSMGIGAQDGAVYVVGGSVRIGKVEGRSDELFQAFINGADSYDSAFGAYPVDTSRTDNPAVSMISIDLKSEIEKRNRDNNITDGTYDELIASWELSIGGQKISYGSPTRFTDGRLYLWLPESANDKEVTVNLTYIDKKGAEQKIEPLFRDPNTEQGGSTLKRYIHFNLPDDFKNLKKYYDGTALPGLTVDNGEHKIATDDGKELTNPNNLSYKFQLYTPDQSTAIGEESTTSKAMPSDVGVMKVTIDSDQHAVEGSEFATSYWGHRATGWCEIMAIGSKTELVKATWEETQQNGDVPHDSEKTLVVGATITKADRDPAGNPTADTCKAPQGYIQLFIDGEPVGDKIRLTFAGDAGPDGQPLPADSPLVNAVAVDNGKGGSFTSFSYAFKPADMDFLVPNATDDKKHTVSVQFLQPELEDVSMARNYLSSTNPAEDPSVPSAEVAIDPIDPKATVELDNPKDGESITQKPPVATDKGGHRVEGAITAKYEKHEPGAENPTRLELKLETPSSGPITVQTSDGRIIEAEVVVDKNGNPVRDEDGKITVRVDPEAVGKTTLTITQAPNGAYTGTVFEYAVTVKADPSIAPEPALSKKAENLTHPAGPTQPGDRIRYTVTASNNAAGSAWNGVVITDALPAALELDEGSVRLANPADAFEGALSKKGTASAVGEFSLGAADAADKRVLSAPVGTVYGGSEAVLTFECTVKEGLVGPGLSPADLGNVAEAEGTRDDPDDPNGPQRPVDPEKTPTAYPEGSHEVAPRDPGDGNLSLSKTVENTTSPDAAVTRVGDTLRYTITIANDGAEDSCLGNARISDPLPVGIEPVAGTLKLALRDAAPEAVDDAAYDKVTRTISLSVGDLWGGESATLTFDCTVNPEAVGTTAANVARLHGTIPSGDPNFKLEVEQPGTPVPVPDDEPLDENDPVAPPQVLADDPDEGDITVTKTAENVTRDDGTTRVGDTVRYTVTLANSHVGTAWMDAAIRDELPRGIEPLTGTLKLLLPDGSTVDVEDAAYDEKTRVLAVCVGELTGGRNAVLIFDALVTESALGADIGNVAVASGTLPSQWDPEGDHPTSGDPFVPAEGWDAYDRTHKTLATEAAYPPGTDAKNGPLPAEGDGEGAAASKKVDDSKTIAKTRLAQTGDDVRGIAALGALAVLAAGALALATRRRARSK